jgi:hypothetical protein
MNRCGPGLAIVEYPMSPKQDVVLMGGVHLMRQSFGGHMLSQNATTNRLLERFAKRRKGTLVAFAKCLHAS